jgi:hypothetical protein
MIVKRFCPICSHAMLVSSSMLTQTEKEITELNLRYTCVSSEDHEVSLAVTYHELWGKEKKGEEAHKT